MVHFANLENAHICDIWGWAGKAGSSCEIFHCSILQGKCKAGKANSDKSSGRALVKFNNNTISASFYSGKAALLRGRRICQTEMLKSYENGRRLRQSRKIDLEVAHG